MSDSSDRASAGTRAYFALMALVGLASIASRFDELRALTPAPIPALLVAIQGPLVMVGGLLESRALAAGNAVRDGFPLWMQIRDPWIRRGFTLSFTFLSVTALQVLDVELGPIDPTPPESFPLAQRVQWFAMFSVGMGFANYLAAVELLVPPLRALAAPLRARSLLWTAPLFAALGFAVSLSVLYLASLPSARAALAAAQAWLGASEHALVVIAAPFVLGALARAQRRPER